jgi:hypothetical protein
MPLEVIGREVIIAVVLLVRPMRGEMPMASKALRMAEEAGALLLLFVSSVNLGVPEGVFVHILML